MLQELKRTDECYLSLFWAPLAVLATVFVTGCGGGIERYPVSGQVLIDGSPLSYGVIRVIPTDARPASSRIDEDGRFTLKTSGMGEGVPAGTHAVEVSGAQVIDNHTIKWHAPTRYNDRKQSGLTIEVTGKADDIVINLDWNGQKPYVRKM